MTEFDREYLRLLREIINNGVEVQNRTGINTLKIPEFHFCFNVNDEFPILQTKQMFYRQAVTEMLWIWQMGSNDVRDLHDRNVHIWDEWMVDDDGIYRIYEPSGNYDPDREVVVMDPLSTEVDNPFGELKPKLDSDGNVMKAKSKIEGKTIKSAKYYGKEFAYTIGTAYGYITNRYKHARNLINTIKNDPTDRRMVKSLWQDEFLRTAVLPSCVWSTEWDVTDGTLNLFVHQRSCDVPLGLPFNITQYSCFLAMIAQVTGLKVGKLNYSIKDAHIYVNQLEGVKEQIRREDRYNELSLLPHDELIKMKKSLEDKLSLIKDIKSDEYKKLDTENRIIDLILYPTHPHLELNKDIDDFFKFDNSKELKDVKVESYKHMGKITFPIAQ